MVRSRTKSKESDNKSIENDTKSILNSVNFKKSEKFSEHELADLMGTNRDTYKRHRGSVRRR